MIKCERLAKRAKDSCGSEKSLGAPLAAAYFILLEERDEFESRCKSLMLENQCIIRRTEAVEPVIEPSRTARGESEPSKVATEKFDKGM